MYLQVEGGDGLKFGDVVTCVASFVVVNVLISVPLIIAFVPMLGFYSGTEVGNTISLFLAALVIGYIFAGKILEARRESIAKITILVTAFVVLSSVSLPALEHWAPSMREQFQAMTGTTTLSTSEWLGVEMIALSLNMFINVALTLVLGFIGLYIGSMLRKPKKS
jgi:hypothetical protein